MRPTTESGRGGRERVAERSHLPFACSHPYPWKQGDARRPIPARSRRRRGRRADRPCWKGRSRGGSCRWRGARRSRDWPVSRSRWARWARWRTSGRSAPRLRAPVEVLERLQGREAGVADPHPCTGGAAGEHLRLEQALEEVLVGPGLGPGALGRLLQPLQDARRLQLGEQVGQPLADLALAHAPSSA